MNCCNNQETGEGKRGFWKGLFYGLTPHIFCIAFIVFTVVGSTAATTLLKPLMLNPYFFYFLVALSFVFATISALIYLKRNGILSFLGMKRKWKYLTVLYGTTLFVNLLFFMVIFPATANLNFKSGDLAAAVAQTPSLSTTLKVAIPCSGHAPLIIGELKKATGVVNVKFRFPNLFDVSFDPTKTSEKTLLALGIFNEFKATVIK